MTYLVFTQTQDGRLDLSRIAVHADRFFEAVAEAVGRQAPDRKDAPGETRIALRSKRGLYDAAFTLTTRAVGKADLRAARDAEARGNVPGMGALAERCAHVWEIEAAPDTPEVALYTMCAVLASVALGPVLPPEHDTLLGVRGSRERAGGTAPTYPP